MIPALHVVLSEAVRVAWPLLYLTGSSLVAFDVVRMSWMPALMSVLHSGMAMLLLLSAFVSTIEIAQQGFEGTTFGLLSSFQSIAKVLGVQLASAIRDTHFGKNFAISTLDIAASSSATAATPKSIVELRLLWLLLLLTNSHLIDLRTSVGRWI